MGAVIARVGLALLLATAAGADDLIPLPLVLPGHPVYSELLYEPAPEVEWPDPKRPLPLVPRSIRQAALGCPVTSSARVYAGSLAQITDGRKEPYEDDPVELSPKTQWVQIDLRRSLELWDIVVWHYHREPIAVHDVVVQVSDDPHFETGVTTLFNNDRDNSSKLGQGADREYVETHLAKIIDGRRTAARYVRLYSRGSTYTDSLNRYTEVEVWATDLPTGRDWVPLPIAYPRQEFLGDAVYYDVPRLMADPRYAGRVEPYPHEAPPTPQAPRGVKQLARGRPVTASSTPRVGHPSLVTDGDKQDHGDAGLEMPRGSQWVQIDLGDSRELCYVALWHCYLDLAIDQGVLVQVSDDPTFASGVATLYDNDAENRSGQRPGLDKLYWATHFGRLIDARRTRARYVRCWSSGGGTTDGLSHWLEVEVWGL